MVLDTRPTSLSRENSYLPIDLEGLLTNPQPALGNDPGDLEEELHEEDDEHREHHGTGDAHALADEAARADVGAQHVEAAGHEAQGQPHHAARDEDGERRHVGGEVHDLAGAGGLGELEVAHSHEEQREEGSRARAVHAVIDAHHGGDGRAQRERLGGGDGLLLLEVLVEHDVGGRDGHHHEHDHAEHRIVDHEGDVRAQSRTGKGEDHAHGAALDLDKALQGIAQGGHGRAHAAAQLVRAQAGVHGKAGDEVGGQRDEAAAAGDGVDEACHEHKRAHDEEDEDRVHEDGHLVYGTGREGLGGDVTEAV